MTDLAQVLALAFGMSALAVYLALVILRARRVVDVPGERRNHARPTPVGAGVGLIPVVLLCLYTLTPMVRSEAVLTPELLLGAALLLAVSFADDVKGLPVRLRLAAQVAAVMLMLGGYWHGPLAVYEPAVRTGLALCIAGSLLWFTNLYNFMDGIDGITGVQTVSIGLGLYVCAGHGPEGLAGLVIAVAALGFLLFNWQPARIFMGDSGSIPLGFLLGVLLWHLAAVSFAAALILPAYYLTDATVTLLRRLAAGERIFEAHSRHYYQQAVRAGWPHRRVAATVGVLNAVLLALAWGATTTPLWLDGVLVLVAYGLTAGVLYAFSHIQHPAHA